MKRKKKKVTRKFHNVPMLGFRSKLELRFSIMLKEAKIAYEYETEKFTLMDKFKQEH